MALVSLRIAGLYWGGGADRRPWRLFFLAYYADNCTGRPGPPAPRNSNTGHQWLSDRVHQICFWPPRWGSLQRSSDPLAGLRGPTSKGRGQEGKGRRGSRGKEKEGEGKERGKGGEGEGRRGEGNGREGRREGK